jgi:hypothetical protein
VTLETTDESASPREIVAATSNGVVRHAWYLTPSCFFVVVVRRRWVIYYIVHRCIVIKTGI